MAGKILKRVLSFICAGTVSLSYVPFESVAHAAGIETTTTINGGIIRNESETVTASDTLTGDANLDGTVNADDAAVLTEAIAAGTSADLKHCDVDFSGVIDQTDADMIESYSTGEITYFPVGTVYNAEASFITRAEWIHALAVGFEMSVEDESSMEYYFTDLENCEYAFEIELAANFGVFDVLGDEFNPDEYVTRDFAAHTMVYCLGIPSDVTVTYSDVDAVYYDKDAQVALTQGWFTAIDGEFRPSMFVKPAEAELAYADMTEAVELSKISENYDSTVVADESVIDISDTEDITISGDTITITGSSITLAEGDVFRVIVDDIIIIRKAVTITTDEALGTMTVVTEACEDELIESVDAEGYAYVDYENITPLTDEIEVAVEEEEEVSTANYFALSEITANLKTKTIKLKDISLKGKLPLGGVTLSLEGKLSNIKVPYKVDMSLLKVKSFYIGFEADASVTATMTASASSKTTKSIPIATVPVIGCGIVNANVVISADVSLSGEISLSYKCSVGGTVQYQNGKWGTTRTFKSKGFTLEAKVEEKLGIKAAITVTLGTKTLGEIYISAGQNGLMKAVDRSDGPTCFDFQAHLYAEIGAKLDLGFGIEFKKSYQIINANNSPLWIELHFEDGTRVAECTYGKTVKKASGSNGGGKSGGYTKGTGYSSGYASSSSGTASHGTSWISKYYSSTITFKELEPPMYITEDTVLTADLEVDSDLYIQADLDLNGYKLTVNGDVYIESGSLTINKGSATVTGDFTDGNYSHIYMSNKDDYLCIEGNYVTESYGGYNSLTAGTLELKGDISGDGAVNSTDMHTVILSGTNDQTINLSSKETMFNMLEIKNSDSKKLIVDKYFLVSNFTEVDGISLTFVCNDSGSDTTDIRLGDITCDTINFDGNLTLGTLNFDGKAINASADVRSESYDGELYLNSATMTVKGDFNAKGVISLGGGTLHVDGDFDYSGWSNGCIYMTNKKDVFYVGGDFSFDFDGQFTEGVMEIKGDIYVSDEIIMSSNHTLILSGEENVSVYLNGSSSYFNKLEIKNTDKRNVLVDGYFKANYTDCGENPLNITSRDGYLSLGELTCSELNVTGNVNFCGSTKLMCNKATFSKNVTIIESAVLKLNGTETTITGDITLENWAELDLGGAKLNVTNYTSQSYSSLSVNTGILTVAEDMIYSGYLYMQNAKDSIIINGDFDINECNNYDDELSAGTIECAGNITSTGSSPINSTGTFKLILNGEADQSINMEYYPTSATVYHFANLEVLNADKRAILLTDGLDVGELTADADTVKITTTTNGGFANAKLRCNLDITGDLVTYGNVFDLNGKTVTVNGNLYQRSGTIKPSTGKLIVNDYYMVTDEDSAVFGTSDGILSMTNAADYVLVNGDFITKTTQKHSNYLTAGTFELKGDFYQYSEGTTFAFPASGTHLTILSGSEVQNITFESYDDSHFNLIKMEQPESMYVFSDNPCWNEIYTPAETTTTTTVTETTTTTTVEEETTTTATESEETSTTTTVTDSTVETTVPVQTTEGGTTETAPATTEPSTTTTVTEGNLKVDVPEGGNVEAVYGSPVEISVESSGGTLTVTSSNPYVMVSTDNQKIIIYALSSDVTATVYVKDETTGETVSFDVSVVSEQSTTTTTATTAEITVTTTTTVNGDITDTPETEASLGDVDNDGAVNSSDASSVLAEYALIATGGASTLTEEQKTAADVNKDGVVDSSDASSILSYYAYTATGGKDSIEVYLKLT